MTNSEKESYNNNIGTPVRCDCGRMVAFIEDGVIKIKCKKCKRIVSVIQTKDIRAESH